MKEHDSDIIDVRPGDDQRVRFRFHFPDGSYITVHVKDGQLRACGSAPVRAQARHADVIAIVRDPHADVWAETRASAGKEAA